MHAEHETVRHVRARRCDGATVQRSRRTVPLPSGHVPHAESMSESASQIELAPSASITVALP
jgi:hypothetical protein